MEDIIEIQDDIIERPFLEKDMLELRVREKDDQDSEISPDIDYDHISLEQTHDEESFARSTASRGRRRRREVITSVPPPQKKAPRKAKSLEQKEKTPPPA